TAPGRQSVVTQAPAEEYRVLAAQLGARRRRMVLALLGLAVVVGVGSVAFVAGRRDQGGEVAAAPASPERGPAALPVPPPPALASPASGLRPPVPPEPPRADAPAAPPAAPGFLQVKAQPWGKLYVDGKFIGDIEGVSRRIALTPGAHTVRLLNGKKSRSWNVEIESGKTEGRQHSFLED